MPQKFILEIDLGNEEMRKPEKRAIEAQELYDRAVLDCDAGVC